MLYVMEWKVKDGCTEKAVNKFLDKGAPMPEESKLAPSTLSITSPFLI